MTDKTIILSRYALLLLLIVGSFIVAMRHYNLKEVEQEQAYQLSLGEQKRAMQIDSANMKIAELQHDKERLLNDLETIKNQKQILYINNVNKSKSDISKLAPEQNKILIGLIEE